MKKIFLKIVAVVCMAFFASLSAFAVGGPEPVELRVSISKKPFQKDKNRKSPFRFPLRQIPAASLDGHTLYFDASCSGCTLQLVDEDYVVAYDVTIPAGATELELPETISGNFVLQIICGRYCYWGWIELD